MSKEIELKTALENAKGTDGRLIFLSQKSEMLSRFSSVEDWVYYQVDPDGGFEENKIEKRYADSFFVVACALRRELCLKKIYVGQSLANELLFNALKSEPKNVLGWIVDKVLMTGISKSGLIVYPLHSFGVRGSLADFFDRKKTHLLIREMGLLVFPQANSRDALRKNIEISFGELRLGANINSDAIDEILSYARHGLDWLVNNPLLVIKAKVFQWDVYENHSAIRQKIEIIKALIAFYHYIGGRDADPVELSSTSSINNFGTLDIEHYILINKKMYGQKREAIRIPMNIERIEMAELSEFSIDVIPEKWNKAVNKNRSFIKIMDLMERLFVGRFGFLGADIKYSARNIIVDRLKLSMRYFLRSINKSSGQNDSTINLTIAFEILFCDSYSAGVGQRIERRVFLALRGVWGAKRMSKMMLTLYQARSEIVHSGKAKKDLDLFEVRKIFSLAWMGVSRLMVGNKKFKNNTGNPMSDLFNEVKFTGEVKKCESCGARLRHDR